MKKLSELLPHIGAHTLHGNPDVQLDAITADSRRVAPGSLFVALRGTAVDGHRFVAAAIESGAAAIVVARDAAIDPAIAAGTTVVAVPDTAEALGLLASAWHDHPSRRLTLVGVTGTNGKTTVATLLYDMARLRGERAGLLSTVVNRIGTRAVPATHTTPDPLELNSLLAQMVDEGCTFAAMEVSSHACAQRRIAGLRFAGGVFTNLTRDHLDYHGTFQAYLEAKRMFFDALPAEAWALVNDDDSHARVLIQNTRARVYGYGLRASATDFRAAVVEERIDGMELRIDGTELHTPFAGRFNASNLLAVYGASRLLGCSKDEALLHLSALHPVAGRFQTFHGGGITAIVDYAHTPDALANVLDTIRQAAGGDADVITVCGCGGDRDHGKRPMMAREAASRSSMLIITSDNPRSEDPAAIAADMLAGLDDDARLATTVELDRARAIEMAITSAEPGGVVLVAGKGHENYQIIGSERCHFDDAEQVKAALSKR